jgi:4-hydroxythreonine-4-phosphate dehydrogenase
LSLYSAPQKTKESLKIAGISYAGHTELLAALTKSKKVAMLMICGKIYGVMMTRHISISKVSENIKTKDIVETINLSIDFIKKQTGKI